MTAFGMRLLLFYLNQFALRNFDSISFYKNKQGAYVLKTQNLERGDYIIKSVLSYYDAFGKNQRKELTLGFKII